MNSILWLGDTCNWNLFFIVKNLFKKWLKEWIKFVIEGMGEIKAQSYLGPFSGD